MKDKKFKSKVGTIALLKIDTFNEIFSLTLAKQVDGRKKKKHQNLC